MAKQGVPGAFDEAHAAAYDKRFARLSPWRDAMLLAARLVLGELGEGSRRILCVGAGTGTELLLLAEAFPEWRFVAVDPAPAMLAVCRRRLEEAGVADRCELFVGYLDALPPSEPFDGATCLLVSQFLTETRARTALFSEIAGRLRPGGLLVSADLSLPTPPEQHAPARALWNAAMRDNGMSEEDLDRYNTALSRGVAVLPAAQVEAILAAAGLSEPAQIFHAALMHAWSARRA